MEKTKILALFGGRSTEYEVSCRSFSSVAENIDREKFEVTAAGIHKNGKFSVYTGKIERIRDLSWENDAENLFPCALMPRESFDERAFLAVKTKGGVYEKYRVDVVLPVIHGANGEDGSVQGLCELYRIPCVGADISGSVVGYDKEFTKIICAAAGIRQGKYLAFKKYEYDADSRKIEAEISARLAYPCFIKPARAGSSVGISKVDSPRRLSSAIEAAFEFDSKVVAEENITGREIEVSIVGNSEALTVSVPGEIKPNADFYDYDAKYINDSAEYFIPARLDPDVGEKVRETAAAVYRLLGITGFSRVDFFVTPENEVVFNEINTIPGFTEISMFAKLMSHSGITYRSLIEKMIALALEERVRRDQNLKTVRS